MANSILSSLTSSQKFLIKRSSDSLYVMKGVKVESVQIRLSSSIQRHMREDGVSIVDSRVINNLIVTLNLIAPTIDDVEDVNDVLKDRENLYSIYSKGIVIGNLMALGISAKQNAEMLSASPFQMAFMDVLQQNTNQAICYQAPDSDIIDYGIQSLNAIDTTVNNFYETVSNNFVKAEHFFSNLFGS